MTCPAGDAGFLAGGASWPLLLEQLDCLPYTAVSGLLR